MQNKDLNQYRDECIIDAYVDNYVMLLSLDELNDEVLYKMYQHVKKILSIECEIRDIKISRLIDQANVLHEFNTITK